MKTGLSISRAWDETRTRVSADGKLLMTVALALIALPAAIAQFIDPNAAAMTMQSASVGTVLLTIVVGVIGIVGQLAIIRLVVGPSLTVGEAIAHGARRTLPYIIAILLLILALFLVAIPFGAILTAMGVTLERGATPPPAAAILAILFIALLLYLAVRMLVTSAVASVEKAGPIAILKRSWQLTGGHWWRLFGFVLLFILGFIIVVGAVSLVITLIARTFFGEIEPLSVAALLVALVEAVASAAATTLFAVMIARIYVQLAGDRTAEEVSVPSSGT